MINTETIQRLRQAAKTLQESATSQQSTTPPNTEVPADRIAHITIDSLRPAVVQAETNPQTPPHTKQIKQRVITAQRQASS